MKEMDKCKFCQYRYWMCLYMENGRCIIDEDERIKDEEKRRLRKSESDLGD